jgi:polygalacturonase
MNVDQANTVIDGLDIRGCVTIRAPGVIIRRSRITCPGSGVASRADFYSGTGVLLEDVEISCGNVLGSSAVADYNFTVRQTNIHSCENGFDIDGRVTIEDSYIHDLLPYNPATDPHTDGAQITPVGHQIMIRHNTINAGDGSAAVTSSRVTDGVVRNVLVQDNLMAGGSYTLYCPEGGPGNNYRVINNRFSTVKYRDVPYGAWTECGDEAQVTGNVYHETGRPVPL